MFTTFLPMIFTVTQILEVPMTKNLFPIVSRFPCWSIGPIISPLFANKLYCLKLTEYCAVRYFFLPIMPFFLWLYNSKTFLGLYYCMGVLTFGVVLSYGCVNFWGCIIVWVFWLLGLCYRMGVLNFGLYYHMGVLTFGVVLSYGCVNFWGCISIWVFWLLGLF